MFFSISPIKSMKWFITDTILLLCSFAIHNLIENTACNRALWSKDVCTMWVFGQCQIIYSFSFLSFFFVNVKPSDWKLLNFFFRHYCRKSRNRYTIIVDKLNILHTQCVWGYSLQSTPYSVDTHSFLFSFHPFHICASTHN